MLPEPLPVIKGRSAREFEKITAKPLTHDQLETFQKARQVYKNIKEK